MNHFEEIYRKLTKLLTEDFAEVYTLINQRHNDGIFIAPLNKTETKVKPYFEINFEKSECTEKDILIENEVYNLSISLYLNEQDKDCKIKLWRYFEAVEELLEEENNVKIVGTDGCKVKIKVIIDCC